jgi:hypothetical protein
VVFELEMDNGQNIYCANKADWNFYSEPVVELIELNQQKHQLSIYPNPSNSTFFVELKNQNESFTKIEIFNLSGDVILSVPLLEQDAKNIFPINEKLSKGVYIVKATSNEHSYCSRICISD